MYDNHEFEAYARSLGLTEWSDQARWHQAYQQFQLLNDANNGTLVDAQKLQVTE